MTLDVYSAAACGPVGRFPRACGAGQRWRAGQYFNWSKYTNPAVTKLLDQAEVNTEVNTNPKSRLEEYYKAEAILMNDAAMIPEHENADLMMLDSTVKNVIDYFGGEPDYYETTIK